MSEDKHGVKVVSNTVVEESNNEKQLWWYSMGFQIAKGFRDNFSNVKSKYKKTENAENESGGLFRRPAQMSGVIIFRSEEEYKIFVSLSGKRIVSPLTFLTFIKKSETQNQVDHFILDNMTLMRIDRIRDGIVGKIRANVLFEEFEVIKQEVLGDDRTAPGVGAKIKASTNNKDGEGEPDKTFIGQGYKKNEKGEWYDPTTGYIYG